MPITARCFLSAVQGFVKAIFTLINNFMTYVDRYKKVAARGVAAGVKKGGMQLRWDAKRNTTLKQNEHHDDASNQAKNPNGDSADAADKTATNKCPVSMVTGEELLTLTDGSLDGILPFDFTRLYRTSAVEIDCGLGFGWSHSLAHRLEIDGDGVIWIDHENRRTTFPLPGVERPAIHNSLSRAAIYLGRCTRRTDPRPGWRRHAFLSFHQRSIDGDQRRLRQPAAHHPRPSGPSPAPRQRRRPRLVVAL